MWSALADRFAACKLVLHPEKTKIVYCKDANRRGDFPNQSFDFLGLSRSERGRRLGRGRRRIFALLPARRQSEGADVHQPGRSGAGRFIIAATNP